MDRIRHFFELWILLVLWELFILFEQWLKVLFIALSEASNIWRSKEEGGVVCIVWSYVLVLHYFIQGKLTIKSNSTKMSESLQWDARPGVSNLGRARTKGGTHVVVN